MSLAEIITPLPGWCTPEKAQVLFDLVKKCDSKISIELGVFGGRSLIPIAIAHKEKGSGFVLGFDPWTKNACLEGTNDEANNQWWSELNYFEIYTKCNTDISNLDLLDHCSTVRMNSLIAGDLFKDNSIDLLHQDSNHSQEITCAEVILYAPKIKLGGYWISDDTDWETTQQSQDLLIEKGFVLTDDHQNYKVFQKQ